MRITRVYTRQGDGGFTRLGSGQELRKDSPRIRAMGAVDELNAGIGVVLAADIDAEVREELDRIQNDLFHLGSDLCILEENKAAIPALPRIEERHVRRLEDLIDRFQGRLGPLEEFILPGGTEGAARLHLARTICRRAESDICQLAASEAIGPIVLPYLNRLSDLLFVLARLDNRSKGRTDVFWRKDLH
jgi:cob(I)alamin adenosyltransferase